MFHYLGYSNLTNILGYPRSDLTWDVRGLWMNNPGTISYYPTFGFHGYNQPGLYGPQAENLSRVAMFQGKPWKILGNILGYAILLSLSAVFTCLLCIYIAICLSIY